MSRRSLLWAGTSMLSVFGFAHWLFTRPDDGGVPWPLRRAFEVNEGLWGDAFSRQRLAKTFEKQDVTPERVNGDEGLSDDFDPSTWKLKLEGAGEPKEFTLADLQKLPHTEMVTELCCIEGWSIVRRWKGVRFADFAAANPPKEGPPKYVAMETPDGGYYVGLDTASAMHPQTLLCWEMNGKPLTLEHGAPLRLVIPVKYGIKNIKRIGLIRYTDERPRDFWAEQGYDWYAGL